MKNLKSKIGFVVSLFILPLIVGAFACSDNGNGGDLEYAQLRVIHLSPDAPAVDVFVDEDESPAVTNLAFSEGTGFLQMETGDRDFHVAPAGASPDDSVLHIHGVRLEAEKSYTAVAFGVLSSIQGMALEESSEQLDSGNIRVRAIHVADGVGRVDIWNIPSDGTPSIIYEDVDFGVAGAYLDLPAQAYTLGFDVDKDEVPDLIFDLPALPAGTIANIFAVSREGEVFLLAQLQDGSISRIDPRGEEEEKTSLRVIHLSPDAPSVDIFANGGEPAAVSELAFQESTGYLELEPGTYSFNISAAGTGPGESVLDIEGLELAQGQFYTAVAFNELSSIQALALLDDHEGLEEGDIRVRAIHTAVGVGIVDIWNLPDEGEPALLYEDVDFGEVGSYLDLPAGAYTLGFDVDKDGSPDVVFELPALPAGTIANVFAVTDGSGVFLAAQLQDGTVARIDPFVDEPARLRVIHLSPDAPGVDVFADGAEPAAVVNLAFQESTDYLEIPAGTYDFNVAPTGTDPAQSVLDITGLELTAGTYYTAVAFDELSSIQALALIDDASTPPAGHIRVRAIHAASAVGQVDIWNVPDGGTPSVLYEDVDFGVAGDYIELPAGQYTIGFDVNKDANPDLLFELPDLPEGTIANVFAVSDGSDVYLIAQLAGDVTAVIPPL